MTDILKAIYDSVNTVEVTTVSTIYKLVLSMLLGSCVGLERKRKGQIAGVRTFALISMGAALAWGRRLPDTIRAALLPDS